MEKLPYQEYRDGLTKKLKEIRESSGREDPKEEARRFLESEKTSDNYSNAKFEHLKEIEMRKNSDEDLEQLHERLFGESPGYLADGLEEWSSICDSQPEDGYKHFSVDEVEMLVNFTDGIIEYEHHFPKDISALSSCLNMADDYEGGELPLRRPLQVVEGRFSPDFLSLLSKLKDSDQNKAGWSFRAGGVIHAALLALSKQDTKLVPLPGWRKVDYDLHRREVDGTEKELLLKAIQASETFSSFSNSVWKDRTEGTISEDDQEKYDQLKGLSEEKTLNWWRYFCAATS